MIFKHKKRGALDNHQDFFKTLLVITLAINSGKIVILHCLGAYVHRFEKLYAKKKPPLGGFFFISNFIKLHAPISAIKIVVACSWLLAFFTLCKKLVNHIQ
jgi:hypothetical protein